MSDQKWLYRKGEITSPGWDVHVDALNDPVLKHTGVRVGDASQGLVLPADTNERIILIAAGESVEVNYSVDGAPTESVVLQGRKDVFHGTADLLYLPINTSASIKGAARVIIGEAPAKNAKPVQVMRKGDVPVFIRGAGRESRQVHNFCLPDTMAADRFICVEVIVPSGNWSGIPAHKHDVCIPGQESNLEEIYYFETAPARGMNAPANASPFGYFRGYASDERPFHVDGAIFDQDTVLVPHGYHGPVAAGPGYDLYFFNVMAGPDADRSWLLTDDPCQGWIRQTWEGQDQDPRLPYNA